MAIQTKLRRWGNSFGVVIPIGILKEKKLNEGEEIIIEIEKINSIKEVFGSLKNWKIDSQKFKEETRRDELEDG